MFSRLDLNSPILEFVVILWEKSNHKLTPVFFTKDAATWVFVKGGLKVVADLVLWAWNWRFSE